MFTSYTFVFYLPEFNPIFLGIYDGAKIVVDKEFARTIQFLKRRLLIHPETINTKDSNLS